jgi:hypothetical protein
VAYQGLGREIAAVMPLAVATGLFVSLCSAWAPTGALTASGAPTGTYAPVSGLQNIPCMNAPTSEKRITADEAKSESQVLSTNSSHVLLAGYYPLFPAVGADAGWQVHIDGVTYDLLGAESDSQDTQTRLNVQVVQI